MVSTKNAYIYVYFHDINSGKPYHTNETVKVLFIISNIQNCNKNFNIFSSILYNLTASRVF